MVAVVEIANLQRPRKKVSVEYLVWFMERTFWAAGYAVLLFGNHVRTREVSIVHM